MWDKLKNNKALVPLLLVAIFLTGVLSGLTFRPPVETKEHVVEDTVSKQKLIEAQETISQLQQQLLVANQTITDLKTNVRVVERIVRIPDGTVITDRTTDTKTESHIDTKTDVKVDTKVDTNTKDTKVSETENKTHKETDKVVTPLLRDHFYLGLSSQVSTTGISKPGVELKVRVLDLQKISFWGGAEVIAPRELKISDVEVRLGVGITW